MTVRLVHGIREFSAGSHMAPLEFPLTLAGIPFAHVSYGYRLIPVTNARAVNAVMDAVQPGDDVIAFSNGCWAALQAAEMGCPIRHLLLISPALHQRHAFAEHLETITVFYSAGDTATWLGRQWRRATRVLPWRWCKPHGWGAMGRDGYQGSDPRVTNINMGDHVGHSWGKHPDAVRIIFHTYQTLREST